MKLLLLVLCFVAFTVCTLDCSETACLAIYEYCEEGSCHTFSGCCPSCCDEPCAECLVSPCEDWACDGHPEFTCREDYCGGCNRLWFDRNGARTECENEVFGVGACTRDCPVVDFCAGCGTVREGCCETCCPESCAECARDPCEGYACQNYPGYQCRSNYCGGCNREWYTSNGEPVVCPVEIFEEHPCATVRCASVDPESCNCGLAPTDGCCSSCCEEACVSCSRDPCEGYTCLDNEKYTCEANYCGGCNRLWNDENGNRVFCEFESVETDCSAVSCPALELECGECGETVIDCCPVCVPIADCFANPCENTFCADNEEYTCEPNYCRGCGRDWFDKQGNNVECKNEVFVDCAAVSCMALEMECGECGETIFDCCPICVPVADCHTDPCEKASCAGHSDYTCQANYCGGCNRYWFDKNGIQVECEREIFDLDWIVECAEDVECALQNVEHGFGCCYEGICDPIDFAHDNWRPVNSEWWQARHEECSENCSIPPMCPAIAPINDNFVAVCKNSECQKVNLLVVNPPSDNNSEEESNSSNSSNSSSATILLSCWVLFIALAFLGV